MKIFGIHILTKTQLASIKGFALGELDKAVAAAKQTEIGGAAAHAIALVEQPGLSGAQKMEKAIEIVAPVVIDYVAKGGLAAVIADAEQFARAVIESTLADAKQTKALQIAQVVLRLIGLA